MPLDYFYVNDPLEIRWLCLCITMCFLFCMHLPFELSSGELCEGHDVASRTGHNGCQAFLVKVVFAGLALVIKVVDGLCDPAVEYRPVFVRF